MIAAAEHVVILFIAVVVDIVVNCILSLLLLFM